MDDINQIVTQIYEAIDNSNSLQQLEIIQVQALGKKGSLTRQLRKLGSIPVEQRSQCGAIINEQKVAVQEALNIKKQQFIDDRIAQQLHQETIDTSLPGRSTELGSIHLITHAIQRISQYFCNLGFHIEDGPEIESDLFNFESLNIPSHHPARAMHDTFYIDNEYLLRTHTSPVQVHVMKHIQPPIHIICPGKVYRRDSDITHTPMFHQVEGLVVDKNINMGHLKYIINQFIQAFFDDNFKVRFRPSYFPFTEPSAEVDIECQYCRGKGCRICSQTGWLEVMGCGMVHPNVFSACNIDTHAYNGLAFGMGVERLAMLRYGITDLRLFFDNDVRFLAQFE